MNSERETQINELLANNPKRLEDAMHQLRGTLSDIASNLHIKIIPEEDEEDEEDGEIIERILLNNLQKEHN